MPWCEPETKERCEWARDSLRAVARRWTVAHLTGEQIEGRLGLAGAGADAGALAEELAKVRAEEERLRGLLVVAQTRYRRLKAKILEETGVTHGDGS